VLQSNRRLFVPNPLAYFPQAFMPTTTQHMVRPVLAASTPHGEATMPIHRHAAAQSFLQRLQNLYRFWAYVIQDYLIHRGPITAL
jgi:hypothetical protein